MIFKIFIFFFFLLKINHLIDRVSKNLKNRRAFNVTSFRSKICTKFSCKNGEKRQKILSSKLI